MPFKNSDYIKLREAAPIVQEVSGVSRCQGSMYHWHKYGRAGIHGTKIKLRAVKRLGLLYTTKQWVEDFIMEIG